jgi:dihydropteroate synthase
VCFEATTPKAPQKLKGFAKSYLLIKDQVIEVEKFKGENSGNKYVSLLEHSTKLKHLYLHVLIDHVRSFFLHLFFIVLSQ